MRLRLAGEQRIDDDDGAVAAFLERRQEGAGRANDAEELEMQLSFPGGVVGLGESADAALAVIPSRAATSWGFSPVINASR